MSGPIAQVAILMAMLSIHRLGEVYFLCLQSDWPETFIQIYSSVAYGKSDGNAQSPKACQCFVFYAVSLIELKFFFQMSFAVAHAAITMGVHSFLSFKAYLFFGVRPIMRQVWWQCSVSPGLAASIFFTVSLISPKLFFPSVGSHVVCEKYDGNPQFPLAWQRPSCMPSVWSSWNLFFPGVGPPCCLREVRWQCSVSLGLTATLGSIYLLFRQSAPMWHGKVQ